MRQGRIQAGFLFLAVIAVGTWLPACGGGGGGGSASKKGGKDLVLTKFWLVDHNDKPLGGPGSTNAFRDVRLMFVFSAPVKFSSVNFRTIRIGIPTGDGLFLQAPGRFEQDYCHPNRVRFNPIFSKNNWGGTPDNPLALDSNALHVVEIPSSADQEICVQNREGDGILTPFTASFITGDEYLCSSLHPPELVEMIPSPGAIAVSRNAEIRLTFSQPMKPESFVLGQTITVQNLPTGRDVLGTIRFSEDARTVIFRPAFGYSLFDIGVRVTTDVTNLAGRPIPKEIWFRFTIWGRGYLLRDVREEFETNEMEDTTFRPTLPLAPWDRGVTTGLLAGTFGEGDATSQAQSLFYDSGVACPQYFDVYLQPTVDSQPAGTSTTFLFQGAPEDPDNPGNPDEDALTDWVADLSKLAGYRFVRFFVEFKGNSATNEQPSYDQLAFAFLVPLGNRD